MATCNHSYSHMIYPTESLCILGGDWTHDYHLWVAMETTADFLGEEFGQSSSETISISQT